MHARQSADQAVLGWHWTLPDHWAEPGARRHGPSVAAALTGGRGWWTRCEASSASPTRPTPAARHPWTSAGKGSFSAQIETPPEKFDAFRQILRSQLRDLAAEPVSADELQRARQPIVEERRKAMENNGHWAFWLAQLTRNSRAKAAMVGEADRVQAVTAEQVEAFFRDRVAKRQPVEVVVRAKDLANSK